MTWQPQSPYFQQLWQGRHWLSKTKNKDEETAKGKQNEKKELMSPCEHTVAFVFLVLEQAVPTPWNLASDCLTLCVSTARTPSSQHLPDTDTVLRIWSAPQDMVDGGCFERIRYVILSPVWHFRLFVLSVTMRSENKTPTMDAVKSCERRLRQD